MVIIVVQMLPSAVPVGANQLAGIATLSPVTISIDASCENGTYI